MSRVYIFVLFLFLASCGGSGKEEVGVNQNEYDFSFEELTGVWESECHSDYDGRIDLQIIDLLESVGEYDEDMQFWYKRKLHISDDQVGTQYFMYITPDCSDSFSSDFGIDFILIVFDHSVQIEQIEYFQTNDGYDAIEIDILDVFYGSQAIGLTKINSLVYLVRVNELDDKVVDFNISYQKIE